VYDRVVDAVEVFIELGIKETMNQYNARPKADEAQAATPDAS
jgi:hypothetical protein